MAGKRYFNFDVYTDRRRSNSIEHELVVQYVRYITRCVTRNDFDGKKD